MSAITSLLTNITEVLKRKIYNMIFEIFLYLSHKYESYNVIENITLNMCCNFFVDQINWNFE